MKSFAEKFFSEREIPVSTSNKVKPHEWYHLLSQNLNKLDTYPHTNVGEPILSTTLQPDHNTSTWFFRGQKDASYAFTSSLARLLLSKNQNQTALSFEQTLQDAENLILKNARANGVGRGLTALETLTILQHHGSPTRLIDVTSDWRVALFFACEDDFQTDGRLFLIKSKPNRWKEFPRIKDPKKAESNLVWREYNRNFDKTSGANDDYPWLSGVWPILLPFTDSRMISQCGYFLVGGIPSPKGSVHLYTSICDDCGQKFCTCGQERYGKKQSRNYLTISEYREVSSFLIGFKANARNFKSLHKSKFHQWTAIGYSVRIPAAFKPKLLEILKHEGIYHDSIYPPLLEISRLSKYLAEKTFG